MTAVFFVLITTGNLVLGYFTAVCLGLASFPKK